MKLTITQEHIDRATHRRAQFPAFYAAFCMCPTAEALRDLTGLEKRTDPTQTEPVSVGRTIAHVGGTTWNLSETLRKQIDRFDEYGPFFPGEYELTLAVI